MVAGIPLLFIQGAGSHQQFKQIGIELTTSRLIKPKVFIRQALVLILIEIGNTKEVKSYGTDTIFSIARGQYRLK